ncbi:MAG: CoA-binding protein [Ignavibacteriales bacterium]|jgi:predicted CoA-binding protein|nr:CoA-binding protein [Ignavibacteriaceae bacterium]NLH61262.1 CoA-binding protein [Ignavibacteriales bacterium]HOJ17239.1 CoA-binding protein [Ignavibacteriaceae bacterium]HPO54428.1 CoA-binding protein [Ignavibacteriaceae bacterium]
MSSIKEILKKVKTISVVGISDKPNRPSGDVALYLKEKGYEVFGVHPTLREFEGIKIYPSLNDIPKQIDLIDIFVNEENLLPIVTDIIIAKPAYVWFQYGVKSESASKSILSAGIELVQDRCIMEEHSRLF